MRSFFIMIVLTSLSLNTWGCHDIDSLFNKHLLSLENTILLLNDRTPVKGSDVEFLDMISFISNIQIKYREGYTHTPLLNRREFYLIKNWYIINRNRLNREKILRYLILVEKTRNDYDQDVYKSLDDFYDAIDREFEELRKMKTFIDCIYKDNISN